MLEILGMLKSVIVQFLAIILFFEDVKVIVGLIVGGSAMYYFKKKV
jgi:hypothetical protein